MSLLLQARKGNNAMTKLSAFLKRERSTRGWSQAELADRSGIPLATIRRYESKGNTFKLSHKNVLELAKTLGIDPGEILRSVGYPSREYASSGERDAEWTRIRGLLEADPRAKRLIELYEAASEEDKDSGVDLLAVHLRHRLRPQ